jgi:hypothetical protein
MKQNPSFERSDRLVRDMDLRKGPLTYRIRRFIGYWFFRTLTRFFGYTWRFFWYLTKVNERLLWGATQHCAYELDRRP